MSILHVIGLFLGKEILFMIVGDWKKMIFILLFPPIVFSFHSHTFAKEDAELISKKKSVVKSAKSIYRKTVEEYLEDKNVSLDALPEDFPLELPQMIEDKIMLLSPEDFDKMMMEDDS